MSKITKWRRSKTLVLIVVTTALLLDSTIVTVIVPILPNFLTSDVSSEVSTGATGNVTFNFGPGNETFSIGPGNETFSFRPGNETSGIGPGNETFNAENFAAKRLSLYSTTSSHESIGLGLLFASKSFFQIIVGPFVGGLTDKIGYSKPMFAGFLIMFISTLTFAFATSYYLLFAARSIQGISSALGSIPGLAMLSHYYTDDKERGNAMSIAFGGTGLGVLIAPTFGAFFYEYFGKPMPFLIIAAFALIDGCLRLFIADPKPEDRIIKPRGPSLFSLFKDPYIMISSGSLFLMHFGIAFLEPSLPTRMKYLMNASSIQQGLAFLPISLTRLLTTTLAARLGYRIGRHRTAICGLVLSGICLIAIPFGKTMAQLIIPNAGLGLSVALIESSILPFLAHLVDVRHTAAFGKVFAIADTSFCLSYCIGPALSGFFIEIFGFEWSLWLIALICFLYTPILCFLSNFPSKKERDLGAQSNYQTF